ncbi:MAG: cytochrome-c peroxidase [Vicinamibacterales bacterium]
MIRALLAVALTIPLGLDLYLPAPEDNPPTRERIEAGRRLFRDRRLSSDRSLACSSCHDPSRAFSTPNATSVGVFDRQGRRNAPALINRGYGKLFFWDARVTTLEEQVLRPIQDPFEMDLSLTEASERVGMQVDDISRALASYVRSILSGNAPLDRFVNGDRRALSPQQQSGLDIFQGKGRCIACHVGPNFTDERVHNTGVAWSGGPGVAGRYLDDGHFVVSGRNEDRGRFKTPTLREVARTSPYMHDGSKATLEDVVNFYDEGGRPNPNLDIEIRPLRLSAVEKRALVSFLRSLSGRVREGR